MTNRIFFDFEFMEDGRLIIPLSLGMVTEGGTQGYWEFNSDRSLANDWVKEHVLPHLGPMRSTLAPATIRDEVLAFAGEDPTFWGYYCDYDWVCLCQMFGRMVDLPATWPKFALDLRQVMYHFAIDRSLLPPLGEKVHHAMVDALWNRHAWQVMKGMIRGEGDHPV